MDTRSKIYHLDDCCCFGARDDITLSLWRGLATIDRVMAQRDVLERTLRQHPRVYSLTAFRIEDMSMSNVLEPSVRAEFEKLAKMMDGPLAAHALVISGSGFIAATVRSAATSLGLLMRNRVTHKVFDHFVDGARWLPTQRSGGAKPGEIDAVESLARSMELQLVARSSKATSSVGR